MTSGRVSHPGTRSPFHPCQTDNMVVPSPVGGPVSGSSLEKFPSEGVDAHGPDGHGAVEVARHAAVVSYNPDAPSEEWGWHGHWGEFAPRGKAMLLWLGVIGLVCLALFGNQVSNVEDYWVIGIAILMAGWIVRGNIANRRKRRIRP